MPLTNDEIYQLGCQALKKMLADHGPDYTFPPDAIWMNVPDSITIPPTSKSHQPRRLMDAGYLELTGGMTRALSEQGAGTIRREYRFGPALIPSRATKSTTAADATTTCEALNKLHVCMNAEGYVITKVELANFFLAMTVSPLVILSGISGTGKSLLPRKFANRTNSLFYSIPVQPQWSDNSDLFGFVPTLAPKKYVQGHLIDGLLAAKRNPDKLVIALLDEMNLAPVEHYFSDFLSVTETRVRKGSMIGSDTLPIELPALPEAGAIDPQAELRGIDLPSNLRVIGTANMDETTHSFSPKVLDRAFTIEFDDPDLTSFASGSAAGSETFDALSKIVINPNNAISVLEARAKNQELFEHIAQLLSEIQDIISPAGVKFGYRTRDAILLYLHFWRELDLVEIMTGYAALDFCILQKVLPKVSGSGEVLADALKKLADWLKARSDTSTAAPGIETEFAGPLERSHQKVSRMIELLNLDGSTRYWGA